MELEIKNISPQKLKSFMLSSNGTVNFLFNGEKAGKGKYENGNLEMDFYTMPKFFRRKKNLQLKVNRYWLFLNLLIKK